MRNRWIVITLTCLLVVMTTGCISLGDMPGVSPVRVVDAYCDENGYFNFTLENRRDRVADVEFEWTLNNPMGDQPVFEGRGNATLGPDGEETFTILYVDDTSEDTDGRFYVMHIDVTMDGKDVASYREQKSPYDWDYSTLPPTEID